MPIIGRLEDIDIGTVAWCPWLPDPHASRLLFHRVNIEQRRIEGQQEGSAQGQRSGAQTQSNVTSADHELVQTGRKHLRAIGVTVPPSVCK